MPLRYDVPPPGVANAATMSAAGFDFSAILGGVQLGRDMSGNFALSMAGIALRRPSGTYVSLDTDEDALLDVTPLLLPGVDPWVIRVPVRPDMLRRGNLIVVSDMPFSPLFVLEVEDERRVHTLDPIAERRVTFVPTINLFLDFVVRAVSMFDIFEPARDVGD